MNIALLICAIACLVAAPALYIIGYNYGRSEGDDEPLEAPVAWRKINLACGPGINHPDSCCAIAGLRAAGYHVEKSGSERGGFVYLKIIQPGHKE